MTAILRALPVSLLGAALLGCSGAAPCDPGPCGSSIVGTTVMMDFGLTGGFYSAPFPSDARLLPDGTADLESFPNPDNIDLVSRVLATLKKDGHGFGTTSGIFFQTTAKLATTDLPDPHTSLGAGGVFLMSVDPSSPDNLRRYPVSVAFLPDGGPFGAPNLLAVLPYQGIPLRPKTRYAAVVLRTLLDAGGDSLDISASMGLLISGARPNGMDDTTFEEYEAALASLKQVQIDPVQIAGLTVFTTGAPTEALGVVRDAMLASPPVPSKPFLKNEVFDDYCVYESTIPMPEYQEGTPPYTDAGGDWVFDEAGKPVLQRQEEANFVITVPRLPMPPNGFPIAVLSRTGAGGERPLVDRGVQAVHDGPPLVPGTGPALYFAKAGFAGASVDGPHGGLRNITHGDEQFLIFNVSNPVAMRDNVRQSAAELALVSRVLEDLSFDATDCPGVTTPGNGPIHFDKATMALMGHSMGATIAPLTLAFEPRYRAGILSGAGGSWIENVIYKQSPIAVKGVAEVLLHIAGSSYSLSQYDPLLSLFQWAGEPADPPVYARRVVREPAAGPPRHVLMLQGIVDTYILPPIANATSLSLGLDLAGTELDADNPQIASFTPLGQVLGFSGGSAIKLPVSANVTVLTGTATAVVVQHPGDGIEDGHEVVFQTEAPKHQYLCFLQGLAAGNARVPPDGPALSPCP